MSDLWSTLPREDCGVKPHSHWPTTILLIAAFCIAAVTLAWLLNDLQCAGYLGGVDCCRMPR